MHEMYTIQILSNQRKRQTPGKKTQCNVQGSVVKWELGIYPCADITGGMLNYILSRYAMLMSQMCLLCKTLLPDQGLYAGCDC